MRRLVWIASVVVLGGCGSGGGKGATSTATRPSASAALTACVRLWNAPSHEAGRGAASIMDQGQPAQEAFVKPGRSDGTGCVVTLYTGTQRYDVRSDVNAAPSFWRAVGPLRDVSSFTPPRGSTEASVNPDGSLSLPA